MRGIKVTVQSFSGYPVNMLRRAPAKVGPEAKPPNAIAIVAPSPIKNAAPKGGVHVATAKGPSGSPLSDPIGH